MQEIALPSSQDNQTSVTEQTTSVVPPPIQSNPLIPLSSSQTSMPLSSTGQSQTKLEFSPTPPPQHPLPDVLTSRNQQDQLQQQQFYLYSQIGYRSISPPLPQHPTDHFQHTGMVFGGMDRSLQQGKNNYFQISIYDYRLILKYD